MYKGLNNMYKHSSTINDDLILAQTEPRGFPVLTQHKFSFSSSLLHAAELPRCNQCEVIKGCPALKRSN